MMLFKNEDDDDKGHYGPNELDEYESMRRYKRANARIEPATTAIFLPFPSAESFPPISMGKSFLQNFFRKTYQKRFSKKDSPKHFLQTLPGYVERFSRGVGLEPTTVEAKSIP